MAAAFRRGLENMADHRHPVDVQEKLLRSRHPRAAPGGEDDAAHGQKRGGKPLERRSGRTNPLHLDACSDRDFRKVAQASAVPVDEQQSASDQGRQVGHLLGQADDRDGPAVASRRDVLQPGIEVLAPHDHRMRAFWLAIRATSNREVEVAHDEHRQSPVSMPDGTRITLS